MKNKIGLIIAIAALCVSVACVIVCCVVLSGNTKPAKGDEDLQYVLYLGTNDKDTNKPVDAPEDAKEVLKDILISHMGGYTIQEANGGWIGDDGTEYQEYTLVIYLSDTDANAVHALCDELIKKFNQSSVLIQMNKITTEFYSGAN